VQLPYEGYFEQLARVLHPIRFGEKYYAMMFGCYLDESFDMKRSGFYVVGGLIGRGVALFELERSWEALLRQHQTCILQSVRMRKRKRAICKVRCRSEEHYSQRTVATQFD
jgi:hypothetical protein